MRFNFTIMCAIVSFGFSIGYEVGAFGVSANSVLSASDQSTQWLIIFFGILILDRIDQVWEKINKKEK